MDTEVKQTGILEDLRAEIARGTRLLSLAGLTSTAAKAKVLYELHEMTGKRIAVVVATNKDLDAWDEDLDFWRLHAAHGTSKADQIRSNSIVSIPSFESDFYAGVSPHPETLEQRAMSLWHLAESDSEFVLLSARSIATRVYGKDKLKNLGAVLKRDEDFEPGSLVEQLLSCGYRREEPIANIGEFSVRGGIVDIFPPNSELPYRIEFFGDTVDSIRTFDPGLTAFCSAT